jgi:hypothetical protein
MEPTPQKPPWYTANAGWVILLVVNACGAVAYLNGNIARLEKSEEDREVRSQNMRDLRNRELDQLHAQIEHMQGGCKCPEAKQ